METLDVGNARTVEYLPRRGSYPKRGRQATKLEWQNNLSQLTSDVQLHNLEFVLVGLSTALLQNFLTIPTFLHFARAMYIQFAYILEVYNLFV